MGDNITVVGNIATDPRHITSQNGTPITSFRLACTERRFDAETREWVDAETNYYTVSAFRALAKNAHASLRRGERIVVTGKLRLRPWENGTKQGIEADIDADSLGHDLRWGTTTFTRAEPTTRGEAADDRVDDAPVSTHDSARGTEPDAAREQAGWASAATPF